MTQHFFKFLVSQYLSNWFFFVCSFSLTLFFIGIFAWYFDVVLAFFFSSSVLFCSLYFIEKSSPYSFMRFSFSFSLRLLFFAQFILSRNLHTTLSRGFFAFFLSLRTHTTQQLGVPRTPATNTSNSTTVIWERDQAEAVAEWRQAGNVLDEKTGSVFFFCFFILSFDSLVLVLLNVHVFFFLTQ